MESSTLFMNISTDQVIISDGENDTFLHRNDVEKALGPKLIQLVREGNYSKVLVLNGPGGFTNLRVGTLCLNVLNTVMKDQLSFYEISKIDLYKIVYDFRLIPRFGIIYIGQKRNVRLRDFEKNEKVGQFSFDQIEDRDLSIYDTFIDEVIEENYYPMGFDIFGMTKIFFDGNILYIQYRDKIYSTSINELKLKELKSVSPNYMMDPNVTIKNK